MRTLPPNETKLADRGKRSATVLDIIYGPDFASSQAEMQLLACSKAQPGNMSRL